MKHLDYDLKIMQIVRVLREQSYLKQVNLAEVLGIDRTTYCRIEHGEIAITPGKLKLMAEALGTNHFQILALADSHFSQNKHTTSFSTLLTKSILTIEGRGDEIEFTDEELEFVVNDLRKKYQSVKESKTKSKSNL